MRQRLRERLILLRYLRDAGGGVVASYTAVRLAAALLPAGTAVATAFLLAYAGRRSIVPPLLVLGGILLVGQVINAAEGAFRALVAGRINGAHRTRLAARVASTETIAPLERQDVQDLLRSAMADPRDWVEKTPADGAMTELDLLVRYAGLASSAAVLASWSWWLVPALVLPAMAVRLITVRQWIVHYRIWMRGIAHSRRYLYWGEVAASAAEGKELRIFGLTRWLIDHHQAHMHTHLDPVWADDRRSARVFGLRFLATALPLGVVYLIVGDGALHGHGSIPRAAAVFTAAWGVFTTMGRTQDAINTEGARPVVRAAAGLDEALPAPVVRTGSRPGREAPVIRFERVVFGYPQADRPVLDGLDLEIRPGELLAVVGANGAGKSTLTKLLAGLYTPDSGRITADGIDIGQIADWRRALAIVFQDFVRYPLSLADNITLGQATQAPDGDRMRAAAREAGLDEVVRRLPAGWDTPLAASRTGGVDLSGGQWQQVALARALYAVRTDARVLVLDEPTAHLDVRTESALFQRFAAGITRKICTLLISHRLSTVRLADRIVLLDGGAVTETGTHDELMKGGGRYAEMFTLQAERFTRGFDDRIEEGELV